MTAVFTLNEGEHVSFALRPAHKLVYVPEKIIKTEATGMQVPPDKLICLFKAMKNASMSNVTPLQTLKLAE